jgi:hypothetical protein
VKIRPPSAAAGAVLVLVGLAGCAQAPTLVSGAGATTLPAGAASPASASASSAQLAAKLGGQVKFPDGLAVATSAPTKFTPAGTAAGFTSGHQGVKIILTVVNGTGAPFNAVLVSATLTYGETGEKAEAVFDSQNRVGCSFQQKILPGKKATAVCGFSVPKPGLADLQLQVSLGDFQHEPAIFTGALA